MSQGYDNSIGETFGLWKDMTPEAQDAWYIHFRTMSEEAGTLLYGEATIHHPRRWPNGNIPDKKEEL